MFKIIYDDNTLYILDIIQKYNIDYEAYNVNNYKENKKAIPIQTRNGSFNTPMIEYVNDNYEVVLWAENTKDWNKSIDELINNIKHI